MYDVRLVINSILQCDFLTKRANITPLRMQKLLYFLNGWHLFVTGKEVAEFKVFPHGPVNLESYRLLNRFRGREINEYFTVTVGSKTGQLVVSERDEMFWRVVKMVMKKYSSFSTVQLCALANKTGDAWHRALLNNKNAISPQEIKKDFERLTHLNHLNHQKGN